MPRRAKVGNRRCIPVTDNNGEQQHNQLKNLKKWRRILYEKQQYPDNYANENVFLSPLKSMNLLMLMPTNDDRQSKDGFHLNNNRLHGYTLFESFCGASIVHIHYNTTVLYLCCFEFTQLNWIDSTRLFILTFLFSFSCAFILLRESKKKQKGQEIIYSRSTILWDHIRTILTVVFFGYAFTPLIRTLTTSISTDSIYTSSILLFLSSLVFHDYGFENPLIIVNTQFSVNLCLTASTFLISRVNSDMVAFSLLALSLCMFCIWPQLRNIIIYEYRKGIVFIMLALLFVSSTILLWCTLHSPIMVIFHIMLHAFTLVFCPLLFIWMQKIKKLAQ